MFSWQTILARENASWLRQCQSGSHQRQAQQIHPAKGTGDLCRLGQNPLRFVGHIVLEQEPALRDQVLHMERGAGGSLPIDELSGFFEGGIRPFVVAGSQALRIGAERQGKLPARAAEASVRDALIDPGKVEIRIAVAV